MQKKIQTEFKIIISGVKLESDFEINAYPYANNVSEVTCQVGENNSVIVMGKISTEDKNENYLIAEDLKGYFLVLFSLFGVGCRIKEFTIDTDTDFLNAQLEISPPKLLVNGDIINSQVAKVTSQYFTPQNAALYHNLIESNNSIDMLHRFRSLFSIFDSLSPKNVQGHIDYHMLKAEYAFEISTRYKGAFIQRYIDFLDVLCAANLQDIKANKNYSSLLKASKQTLNNDNIINEDVAFYLLKCIQIIRNKVNHGDFSNLDRKVISCSYELLLPIVQKMLRN